MELTHEVHYWVALHELVHIILELPTVAVDGKTVLFDNEQLVWEKTLELAVILPRSELEFGALHMYPDQVPTTDQQKRMDELAPELGAAMRFKEEDGSTQCGRSVEGG